MSSTQDREREGMEETGKADGETDAQSEDGDETRRRFLKLSLVFGLALAIGGIASVARSLFSPSSPEPGPPPPTTQTVTQTVTVGSTGSSTTGESETSSSTSSSPFPRVMVANITDLSGGKTVVFNYPLEETPNVLAKLGAKAEGGVGPDGDIVAFSTLCQHLGCVVGYVPTGGSPLCNSGYKASGPVGYCCCHGSVYDFANGANVIAPPAPRPLPQVTLEFDSSTGNIYAVGMGPPTIFGHNTGSNDVLDDLQGGTPVG
jgi:arsenite oxidase small subunit